MHSLLLRSEPITLEQKGQIIHCMHTQSLRTVLGDTLTEINSPKAILNIDCLRQIADIIKFLLTLFVHEQSNDHRLLYSILESSHHIYFLSQNKRKQFLYSLLEDHGIWHGDAHNWRECILEAVNRKVEEAVKRKQRKEMAAAGGITTSTDPTNTSKNFFKKGFK